MKKSLYIHIPFCRQKCLYCDFYSLPYNQTLAESYLEALCRQIDGLDGIFSTIYIGGGTPSVLPLGLLRRLMKSLNKISNRVEEFTIEANPESLNAEKLNLFSGSGVNRLSIGIQSFSDNKLRNLGRSHDSNKAVEAIRLAKRSGFKNIGIDLIFGASRETLSEWLSELKQAVSFDLKHISAYCLSYEKSTPLFLQIKKKLIVPLDDEILARMYIETIEYLSKRGFKHYEISNFARPGFESRHNNSYWEGDSYLGLGPSAVSFTSGKGRREKNTSDLIEYIDKVRSGKSPVCLSETLTGEKQARELAAVKIRTKDGIDFDWYKVRTGYDFLTLESQSLEDLFGHGLVKYRERNGRITGIYLSKKGFCFSDTVSSAFL